MEKNEKLKKLAAIKKLIDEKHALIAEIRMELSILEKQLIDCSKTEIPLLLFVIEESSNNSLGENTEYEFVYYYPDLGKVQSIFRHTDDDFLPDFVDMRDCCKDFQMPKQLKNETAQNYPDILNAAVESIKKIIDNMFDSNIIYDWKNLAFLLRTYQKYYTLSKYEIINSSSIRAKILEPKNENK